MRSRPLPASTVCVQGPRSRRDPVVRVHGGRGYVAPLPAPAGSPAVVGAYAASLSGALVTAPSLAVLGFRRQKAVKVTWHRKPPARDRASRRASPAPPEFSPGPRGARRDARCSDRHPGAARVQVQRASLIAGRVRIDNSVGGGVDHRHHFAGGEEPHHHEDDREHALDEGNDEPMSITPSRRVKLRQRRATQPNAGSAEHRAMGL